MNIYAIAILLLPTIVFSGTIDHVTKEAIANGSGVLLEQIIDGEKIAKAYARRGNNRKASVYRPALLIAKAKFGDVEKVQCGIQKLFSINADEPNISGTHTEFDVMRITIALCDSGPFTKSQINVTAKNAQTQLKELLKYAQGSPRKEALMQIHRSKLYGDVQILSFTIPVFGGHGAGFLPTAVAYGPQKQTSLIVQIYFADYMHRRLDPVQDQDNAVTAPLRRASDDPLTFAEDTLRAIYSAVWTQETQQSTPAGAKNGLH